MMNFFPGIPILPNNMMNNIPDNYMNYINNVVNKYNDLEDRIKKIEDRLYKLEHLSNMNNPTPDNSVYML